MLKLAEIRKTTRATGSAGLRTVHPHFLRDRSLHPRIDTATRYLDALVGQARGTLDQEVMIQFFGDHKLARGIAAGLASSYIFRQLTFSDVLGFAAAERLANRGLATASDLRLWLFRRANLAGSGFVGLADRAKFLDVAAAELAVAPEMIDRLMTLDAAANAVLARSGLTPRPEDVVARYNFQVAAALLTNSSLARITLRRPCADVAAVRELCALAGVRAEASARELVLNGRQDVFGGWARYGARLARLVSDLLATGLPARALESVVEAGERGQWLFKADEEVLTYLGMPRGDEPGIWTAGVLLDAQRQLDGILSAFAGLRRAKTHRGWSLRRASEPFVTARGAAPVVATAVRAQERVAIVPLPASGSTVVARMLGSHACLALNTGPHPAEAMNSQFDQVASIASPEALELVPHMLDLAVEASERAAARQRLQALFAEVERTGVMTEARVARYLGCPEEAVTQLMAEPEIRAERECVGMRYVEGFGVCTGNVLARAHDAAREVAELRGGEPAGPAWTARVLGRRLREVTGATEGIECLIAYLGAA